MSKQEGTDLDLKQAKEDIESFNTSLAHLAGDFLTHEFFRDAEFLDGDLQATRVVLIDVLWATGVNREGTEGKKENEKPLHTLCKHLYECGRELRAELKPLEAIELQHEPEAVFERARPALELIFKADLNSKNLSFASKFLHWLAPNHCPIIDERADAATHRLLRGLWADVPSAGAKLDEKVRRYRRWIWFYSLLLQKLKPEDKMGLIGYDEKTQRNTSKRLARKNTILRVLDKHFWIHGGGLTRT